MILAPKVFDLWNRWQRIYIYSSLYTPTGLRWIVVGCLSKSYAIYQS